jgi:transposase
MDSNEAIIEFLGLQGVKVEKVSISKNPRKVIVTVRHDREECFCSRCGSQFDGVKAWEEKTLEAPPLGIYSDVEVELYQLRGVCDGCDRSQIAEARFIHPKFHSMTCGFAEVAGRLMEEITCEAVSRLLHTDSMTMWRLDQWRMGYMEKRMRLPEKLDVSELCADEVHFRTVDVKNRKGLFAKRREPQFVTNLICPKEGKVISNALGRDSEALEECLLKLTDEQLESVKDFAVDMHEPFLAVIRTECKNAQIAVDRFHLIQKVNEAFDKVRRSEFDKARKQKNEFVKDMLEPHRRFILVSREKDLSLKETKLLEKLRETNKEIHTAMLLVEYFHKALDKGSVESFRKALRAWYLVVRESKLKPFLKLCKLIRKYRTEIENYIESGLTTGVAEGINNKIKVLKRMGYGYTNKKSFPRKILQRCGYLNSRYINTDDLFYCVTP